MEGQVVPAPGPPPPLAPAAPPPKPAAPPPPPEVTLSAAAANQTQLVVEPCTMSDVLMRQLESIDSQLQALRDGLGTAIGGMDRRLSDFRSLHEQQHGTLFDSMSSMHGRLQELCVAHRRTGEDQRSNVGSDTAGRGGRNVTDNSVQSGALSSRAALQMAQRHQFRLKSETSQASSNTNTSQASSIFNAPAPKIGTRSSGINRQALEELRNKSERDSPRNSEDMNVPHQQWGAGSNGTGPHSTAGSNGANGAGSNGAAAPGSNGSTPEAPFDEEEKNSVASAIPSGSENSKTDRADSKKAAPELESRLSLGDDLDFFRHVTCRSFSTMEKRVQRFIVMPGSQWRFIWDVATAIATVVTGVALPIGLAYLGRGSLSQGLLGAILCIVDVLWICSIAANFRTAYFCSGDVVTSPRRIASRYLSSWFLCDIITAWPLVLMSDQSAIGEVFQVGKMLRLTRFGGMFLNMRTFVAPGTLYPASIAATAMLSCNILACGWRAVTRGDFGTTSGGTEGGQHLFIDKYVQDIYFLMMTMSTVGFGDIYPKGTGQRFYAILTMLIAPLIFGAVVSLISHGTEGVFNDKVAAKVTQTVRFMKRREIPQELQHRVQHNLRRNALQESEMMLAPDLLSQLSPAVQRELLSELLRSTVLQFPLFRGANTAFIGELAQAHTWVHCLPGDIVVEEGQIILELVFVVRGKLIMQESADAGKDPARDKASNPYQVMPSMSEGPGTDVHTGAWFGEGCLFYQDRTRDFTAVAVLESELAVLEASRYHRIVRKYPRVFARHEHIAAALGAGKLELDMMAYNERARSEGSKPAGVGGMFGNRGKRPSMIMPVE